MSPLTSERLDEPDLPGKHDGCGGMCWTLAACLIFVISLVIIGVRML